jgi:HNH endonuclease.
MYRSLFVHVLNIDEAKSLGFKEYFTAIPCVQGHFSPRYTSSLACIECSRIARTRWGEENREKRLAYSKKYREDTKESRVVAMKEWREKNREHSVEYARAYRRDNPKKSAEISKKYRDANPEIRAAHGRNRRARERLAEGSHTHNDVTKLLEFQGVKCANCRCKLFKSGPKKYHVDHVMPLILGGSNKPDNLQILCPGCNTKKGGLDPLDWAKKNGKLL